MPSRRNEKVRKAINLKGLRVNTRRLSIQIKRLSETAVDTDDFNSLPEVEKWQHEIHDHLNKMNHLDVLEKSDRVFNMKEAYFSLRPTSPASPFLTTLIVISASGIMASTAVFFPNNELHPRNIIFANESNTASICELTEDHLTNDNILSYMQFTFYPWLISKQQTTFPVIVFIDIDPVHISWDTLTYCKENQIILLRTTPALRVHPISSFVLPHVENAWNAALHEWSNKNGDQPIALESAPSMLGQVFEKTVSVDLLTSGFSKCGTFPFDPVTVYKHRTARSAFDSIIRQPECTLKSTTEPVSVDLDQSTIEITQSLPEAVSQQEAISEIQFVNETPIQPPQPVFQFTQARHTSQSTVQFKVLLGPLIYEFINAGTFWTGAVENTSLFDVWQRLLKTHQHFIHDTPQTTHPQAQEINQKFRIEFEGLIGPLLYDFRKSENVWTGATENKALFEVWQHIINASEKQ